MTRVEVADDGCHDTMGTNQSSCSGFGDASGSLLAFPSCVFIHLIVIFFVFRIISEKMQSGSLQPPKRYPIGCCSKRGRVEEKIEKVEKEERGAV